MSEFSEKLEELRGSLEVLSSSLDGLKDSLVRWNEGLCELRERLERANTFKRVKGIAIKLSGGFYEPKRADTSRGFASV